MDADAIRRSVLRALRAIAPEVEEGALDPRVPLRDQVDLDSIDLLRFLGQVEADLGVDLSEMDRLHLTSLDDLVAHLATRLARVPATGGEGSR